MIYDILGGEISSLINEMKAAGNYTVVFNGSNLANGIYLVKMKVNDLEKSIKMVLAK